MDARGPQEARLLAVERGIGSTDGRLRTLQRKTIALSQGVWQLWSDEGSIGGPATGTPTSYSGTVNGCSSGVSGVVVTITDHATGMPLGMATTGAGGAFSGTVSITGTVSVDFAAGGVGWVTTTVNASMTAGMATLVGNINLSAATGYVCVPPCNFPIPTTITVTDSAFGVSFPAFYAGVISGNFTWSTGSPPQHVSYPGGGGTGCSAVGAVPVTYTLQIASSYASSVFYVAVGLFNACPAATGSGASSPHTLVSSACPPTFSVVFENQAAQKLYSNAAAGTYTITWSP